MDKGDKWQRELEDIKDYVKKQVKKMVESREIKEKRKKDLLKEHTLDSATLRLQIIQRHHDHKLVEHLGYTKTHKLITRNYWQPHILPDIRKYVLGYEQCQINKTDQPKEKKTHCIQTRSPNNYRTL